MKSSLMARVGSSVVGLALLASAVPAFAETSTTTATTTPGSYNVACVQTAIGVHEDAKIAARSALNAANIAARLALKADLVAAWGQTDFTLRFNAMKAAFVKYRTAENAARTNSKNSFTTANTTFQASMKACGVIRADLTGTTTPKERKDKEHKERGERNDNDKDTRGHDKKEKIGLGLGFGGGFGLHFGNKDR